MDRIVENCCGLDVHQAKLVACVLKRGPSGRTKKTLKTFGTLQRDLVELRHFLAQEGVQAVAMESTGVYWVPVYEFLEKTPELELIVGNAHHIKNVPGRKTDMKDAEWLADLARHGLIRSSFVPSEEVRVLREFVRYRRTLVQGRTTERNRLLRLLARTSVKLATVMSDVFGKSGVAILRALVAGERDPAQLADLARGRLRKKRFELQCALEGTLSEPARVLLGRQLQRLDQINEDIAAVEEHITKAAEPFAKQIALLQTIPGVSTVVAATIISEIGVDMTVFRDSKNLVAWAGVAPGNNESAGRKKRAGARKGNIHLRSALFSAATVASKQPNTYLRTKYRKMLATGKDRRVALMTVAHKILIAAYHMLAKGERYKDLGESHLDSLARKATKNALVNRLIRLGYSVTVNDVGESTQQIERPLLEGIDVIAEARRQVYPPAGDCTQVDETPRSADLAPPNTDSQQDTNQPSERGAEQTHGNVSGVQMPAAPTRTGGEDR